MRRFSFILILGALVSCETPSLKLNDLDFADIEEHARKKLNVDTTYIISLNTFADINKLDTIARVIFNNEGKLLIDGSNPFSTYKFEYDSNGIVKKIRHRDFDIYLDYISTTTFIPDSLILRQKWTGDDEFISEYRFSETGQLQERLNHIEEEDWLDRLMQYIIEHRNKSAKDIKTLNPNFSKYWYDDSGLLITKEDWVKDTVATWLKSTTKFYYGDEDNIIDSTVMNFPDFNYRTKTIYDDDGLRQCRIYNDTLKVIFAHVKSN